MKILDVMSNCPTPGLPGFFGGAELSRELFCDVLTAGGHEVVSVRGHDHGLPEEAVRDRRVLTIPFPSHTAPSEVGGLSGVERIIWHGRDDHNSGVRANLGPILEAEKPDVVLTANLNGLSSAVWTLAASHGLPIAHYLHDHYLTCHRTVRFRGGRICEASCAACSCLTLRRRRATSLVHSVIGNSAYLLDHHTKLGLFANARQFVQAPYVHTTDNPVRPKRDGGQVRLGFLGRVSFEKGLEALIEARRLMLVPTDLLVGGPASDATRARLSALSPERPITFAGLVEPASFLTGVDLLVAPSLSNEPFGRVVLEGWSAGIAVAASRRGGVAGLVPADWQFEPNDLQGFAETLDRQCGNAAALALEGRRGAAEARTYTASKMLAGFESALRHAVSAAPARHAGPRAGADERVH